MQIKLNTVKVTAEVGQAINVTIKTNFGGGGGGTSHPDLSGRSLPDQHPIEAITGLVNKIVNYPTTAQGKFLKDDATFDYPNTGGGGGGTPVYMSNLNSDIAGYKKLTTSPDVGETIKTITANNSTVSGEAYLFDLPINISLLNAGAFQFGYYRSVSSAAGESYKQLELFVYHTQGVNAGTETVLGFFESSEINETVLTERFITRSSTQNYVVDPTDRFGVRSKFRTTRNADTTLSYVVGGQRAWYMVPPIPPRHDSLRDKDGNLDFQHLNNDQKFNGGLATGVVNPSPIGAKDLSTVKKLANAFDKASTCLLRTVSVPTNTASVVINTTDNGIAFADLNINQINISISGILLSDTVTNCFIGVNGLYAESISNYYQLGTGTQPSGFLNIIRKYFSIHGVITATNGDASAIFSSWRSTALNPTSNVASLVQGGVKFGNIGGKITEVRIIVSGANFDDGTTIKITKIC